MTGRAQLRAERRAAKQRLVAEARRARQGDEVCDACRCRISSDGFGHHPGCRWRGLPYAAFPRVKEE